VTKKEEEEEEEEESGRGQVKRAKPLWEKKKKKKGNLFSPFAAATRIHGMHAEFFRSSLCSL